MGTILGLLINAIAFVVPFWFLLPRAGIPSQFAFVALIPFLGAALLVWMLAFKRWPDDNLPRRF